MNPEATKVLRDEHVLILEVAGVLERILEAEATAGALDVVALEECVRFLRLFADACHHGKEEDLLFPELESVGMPRSSGPIAVMLDEHRRGRAMVSAMARTLEAAGQGNGEARERFMDAAYAYLNLIRGHILKEDNVLFNMADQMVEGSACQRLCQAYEGVCARRFEGCTKAELEDLASSLRKRYPAR